jgi:hypothetical protein
VLQDAGVAVHARAREGHDTGGRGRGARRAAVLARAALAHFTPRFARVCVLSVDFGMILVI